MGKVQRERIGLFMWPQAIQTLREMAFKQGHVVTAGRGTGQGSVSNFLEAVARGEYLLMAPGLVRDLEAIAAQLGYHSLESWLLDMTNMDAPGPLGKMPWVARHIYESAGSDSPEMLRIRELEREMLALMQTVLEHEVVKLLPEPQAAIRRTAEAVVQESVA